MSDSIGNFYNKADDCVYFFDKKKQKYRKVCDLAFGDLPLDVKQYFIDLKEQAKDIAALPIGGGEK